MLDCDDCQSITSPSRYDAFNRDGKDEGNKESTLMVGLVVFGMNQVINKQKIFNSSKYLATFPRIHGPKKK